MAYNRIFLSHKGVDKDMVKEYKAVLEAIGLQPWFDQEDLKTGDELESKLEAGMADSCAAVFFVTPSFRVTGWLKREIEFARQEKASRGEGFAIITLLIADETGKRRRIPRVLNSTLWAEPKKDLEVIRHVVQSLPPCVLRTEWYLPLCEIVPPRAQRVAIVGQNLAQPLKEDYLKFFNELKQLLSPRRFPSLEMVTLVMMTPKALLGIHPKAAKHMRTRTLLGLTNLSKDLKRNRIRVVLHRSATLSMVAVDWHKREKAFAFVTPKIQITERRPESRARVLLAGESFEAEAFITMMSDAEDRINDAVSTALTVAPAMLEELLSQVGL